MDKLITIHSLLILGLYKKNNFQRIGFYCITINHRPPVHRNYIMMIDFIDSKALLQASVQEELYENLVSQIVKDCALANSPIDLPFKVSPQNLKTIIHQKVYRLITNRFADYLNLLYIIDVPEKIIKEIQATNTIEIADQVSFLILKREFQKVWFKKKYS
jgi:hypothetical protein